MTRPQGFHRCCLALLVLATACVPFAMASPAEAPSDFDRTVAPLLAGHCLDCHGKETRKGGLDLSRSESAHRGGDSGPAVVPGNLDESVLWEKVESGEMPPKTRLTDAEKATLKAWIESGAKWGADPIDPFRFTSTARAGLDWWSLQPVRRTVPPEVHDPAWARNPIDRFVLAKLESKQLTPSPEADRRTLIRRLAFDLTGLPPSPEQVRAFETDCDPLAYEKLVERLLAAPQFGERWARHWLDVVRYGESDGFERNTPRRNSWPYRDWVVRAFNTNLPADEFCRMQLAGDLSGQRPADPDRVSATGYLVAGIHNTVIPMVETVKQAARQDEMEDLVGNIGQTYLGLTINCARCHDHKFDPISQVDYYRMTALLSGVEHGERDVVVPAVKAQADVVQTRLQDVEDRLRAIEQPARLAFISERIGRPFEGELPPLPVAAWDLRDGLNDLMGSLHLKPAGPVAMTSEGAKLDGQTTVLRSPPVPTDLREKTLEAWVRLGNLSQQGGGVMTLESTDGGTFDAIVYGEQEAGRWLAGSDNFNRTRSLRGEPEREANDQPVHVALTYRADGTITAYRNGRPYGKPYRAQKLAAFDRDRSQVAFGIRHEPTGGNRMLDGVIVRARLYNQALTAAQVAASASLADLLPPGAVEQDAAMANRLDPSRRAERASLSQQRDRLRVELTALQAKVIARIYAANPVRPPETRLLARGQVTEPRELITPAGLAALSGSGLPDDLGLSPDASDADRRRKLADWLTSPSNPLFPRVMVNRLWHYHFGVGIVETPNDFGFNGGRPSHPELLDWLAAELVDSGYDLKHLHRLIVTSAAYRQQSLPRPEAMKIDADNRLVWRMRPTRVQGEVLRDTMLSVAGLINLAVGGPPFSDYQETFGAGTYYFDPIDPVGPEFHRRSLYRFTPRGSNLGILDAFDCPDPSAAAPRRNVTTTPLQALALWNDAFSLRIAETLAHRVKDDCQARGAQSQEETIAEAYQLIFQREPSARERALATNLVARHGLPTLCRALLNTNEFLTVD